MKLLSIIFILVFGLSAFGQKTSFAVSLNVQSKNSKLAETVESYISRELRSLGDVEITKKDAFYEIKILAVEDASVGGRQIGYTLSVVVNWQSICISFPDSRRPCYVFDDHLLHTGAAKDLRSMCEDVVTSFDTRSLKPLRPSK